METLPPQGAGARPAAPAVPAAPSRVLLALALVFLAAGLVLALYVILHRAEYVVLVGTDRTETRWLQARMDRFAEAHHVRIALQTWSDPDDVVRRLAQDRAAQHPRLLIADVPFERVVTLADTSGLVPLSRLKELSRVGLLLDTYPTWALGPAQVGGHTYLLPSRLRTLCLYYSKAHVADAFAHWTEVRPQIEAWLKAVNGRGLPASFTFESDPAQWDSYDVFVASAYWALHGDAGPKLARVAHVVAPAGALALDLASRDAAMGGNNGELLDVAGERLGEALAWESLFFRCGLYHPAMMKERWTSDDVLGAVAQGQVWMATLEPRDIFRLRGLPGQDGFARDPADIGVASMPTGRSLLLAHDDPARSGDASAARTGYGWGVPASCPDRGLAAALLRELSDEEFTVAAAQALGWIPPRIDVEGQLDVLYRDRRSYEIARVGAHQLVALGHPMPESPRWAEAEPALARLWQKACVHDRLTDPLALVDAMRAAQAPRVR